MRLPNLVCLNDELIMTRIMVPNTKVEIVTANQEGGRKGP